MGNEIEGGKCIRGLLSQLCVCVCVCVIRSQGSKCSFGVYFKNTVFKPGITFVNNSAAEPIEDGRMHTLQWDDGYGNFQHLVLRVYQEEKLAHRHKSASWNFVPIKRIKFMILLTIISCLKLLKHQTFL